MKRLVKNIIMVLALVLVIGATGITMIQVKNSNTDNTQQMAPGGSGGTPPEKPDGDSSSLDSSSSDSGSSGSDSTDSKQTPPEKPDGDSSSSDSGSSGSDSTDSKQTPPEKPDGDNNSNGTSGQQGGAPADMAAESTTIATLYYVLFGIEGALFSILVLYLILSKMNKKTLRETFPSVDRILVFVLAAVIITASVTYADGKIAAKYFVTGSTQQGPGGAPGGGTSSADITYAGAEEITEDTEITSGSYSSDTADENAILVNGDYDVSLSGISVDKSGDSDGGDNTSFYGTNSGILAADGANLTLDNITVNTTAKGANGVFCYGGSATTDNQNSDGTTVTISNSKITTTGDNAGGIMTTGGGTTNASNLTIETAGTSSASIRTDRGGGTVNVDGGSYTTTGQGSPTVYSTANVTVSNATLTAKASEGIVIEGKNQVTLKNCDLTDSNTKLNGKSTTYKNIFLYQSMSGDAAEGNAEFDATDCNITTNNGDTFYITNTAAVIALENNTIVNQDADGNFLRAQADSWGNEGENGGDVTLTMKNQKASGNIVIDSVSTLDMTMSDSSSYEGTINGDNTAKSLSLTLDKDSTIKLTGDSYVTSFKDADSSYSNIDFNGYTLYVNGTAINK